MYFIINNVYCLEAFQKSVYALSYIPSSLIIILFAQPKLQIQSSNSWWYNPFSILISMTANIPIKASLYPFGPLPIHIKNDCNSLNLITRMGTNFKHRLKPNGRPQNNN